MNIKQQLEQVIANLHEHADQLNQLASDLNATSVWHKAKDIEEIVIPRLSAIVEQMDADEQAIVDEVNKRWPTSKPQPDDMFVGAAPQVPDGMVLVPEVLLRQIAKWLAESADPYDKAAYAINGLIAAAEGKE